MIIIRELGGYMKKVFILLTLLFSVIMLSARDSYPISLNISGGGYNGTGFFNSIKAASIDVDNPNMQPIIFNMYINTVGSQSFASANIFFSLTWNGIVIIDNTHRCPLKPTALQMLTNGQTITVSNRDLISENGNPLIGASEPSMSLSELLSNSNFDTAIRNTGLFPDGNYQFTMQIKDNNDNNLSNESSFVMSVQNINNINLITPGVPVGSEIPSISSRPLLFSWISNITNANANPFSLEIREYSQLSTIDFSNLGNSGSSFFSTNNLTSPLFNQNLPFMDNNYYAWRVKVPLITDQSEFGQSNFVESQWYIFKFGSASSNPIPNPYLDLLNAIQNIQNPTLVQYLGQGYLPTGKIKLNGNSISPAQAISLLPQIINSNNVTIEIVD